MFEPRPTNSVRRRSDEVGVSRRSALWTLPWIVLIAALGQQPTWWTERTRDARAIKGEIAFKNGRTKSFQAVDNKTFMGGEASVQYLTQIGASVKIASLGDVPYISLSQVRRIEQIRRLSRREMSEVKQVQAYQDGNFRGVAEWCRQAVITLRNGESIQASCALIGNMTLYGAKYGDVSEMRTSSIVAITFQ